MVSKRTLKMHWSVRLLIKMYEFHRTYRILGFICLACNTLAIILVMARIPRRLKGRKKKLSDIVQLGILKDVNLTSGARPPVCKSWVTSYHILTFYVSVHSANSFEYMHGLTYSLTIAYSTWLGLTASDGTALVAVASAANVAGRILAG